MSARDRVWRQVPPTMFQFTTTERADLRIAVMQVFHVAAIHEPALTFAEIRDGLADVHYDETVNEEDLALSLKQLEGWNLLESTQDHAARYATPEEFERRNLRWALTPHGEAAIGGVVHSLEVLRRTVSLQPATLDAIGDGLADLVELLAHDAPDTRITSRLAEVEHHLQALVDHVRQFNRELNRLQRDDATADEVFLDVKQRVTSYLQEFVDGVDRPTRRIRDLIGTIENDHGVSVLLDRALRGANLLHLDGDDPSIVWLEERTHRWDGLRSWFAPADGAWPQIDRVLDVARQAILALLRVLERRWESRRRAASVRDDFLVLARWFAAVPTDADAHRLYNAAFGLWPARHHHLVHDDPDDVPAGASWGTAPPVPVAASLRTTGSVAARGRSQPVIDPAIARARRQERQAADFAARDAVRRHLLTRRQIPLAAFQDLDLDQFDALLDLLSVALAAGVDADGVRRGMSVDGLVEIDLHPPPAGAGRCRLAVPSGTLTAPAYEVEITLAGTPLRSPIDAAEVAS